MENWKNTIHFADCLDILPQISDNSIHLIATDLPYLTTESHWECPIDIIKLFNEYRRILTDKGTIVMTVCFPFGLGTTLIAAKNCNRYYIGIEKDQECFEIIKERLEN